MRGIVSDARAWHRRRESPLKKVAAKILVEHNVQSSATRKQGALSALDPAANNDVRWLAPALALVGVAAAAGVADGLGNSFWRDEASTAGAVDRSLPELLRLFENADGGFAGYYLLLWPWIQLAGTSEASFRLPSMAAMAATVVVCGLLAARISKHWLAGVTTGVLLATSPVLFPFYAVEARPYAFTIFFVSVAGSLAYQASLSRRSPWWWALASAVAISTHVLAVLAIGAQALWLLLPGDSSPARHARRIIRPALAVVGVTAVMVVLASQAAALQSWIPEVTIASVTKLSRSLITASGAVVGTGAVIVCAIGRGRGFAGQRLSDIAVLAAWSAAPLLLLATLSVATTPSLLLRYVLASAPGIAVLIGVLVVIAWRTVASLDGVRRLVGGGTLLLFLLAGIVLSTSRIPLDADPKLEDLQAAMLWVETQAIDADLVDQADVKLLYVPTWAELGPRWYATESEVNYSNVAAQPARDEVATSTLFRQSLDVSEARAELLASDHVFVLGYPNFPTWEPVEEIGLKLADTLEDCFVAEQTQHFGQLQVEQLRREGC